MITPTLKAVTLTQPWATLVARGKKRLETRSWHANYTGILAIHAALNYPPEARSLSTQEPFYGACLDEVLHDGKLQKRFCALPQGYIVAIGYLIGCVRIGHTPQKFAWTYPTVPRLLSECDLLGNDWSANQIRGEATVPPQKTTLEYSFGDYTPGRWAWILADIQPLTKPVQCRGALSIWDVPEAQYTEIQKQFR